MSKLIKEKSIDETKDSLIQLGLVAVAVVAAALIVYMLNFRGGISDSQEVWAQFGDYFGGVVGPIISFLGLLALLLTIVLQSRQLKLSSEELKATREELSRSASAQEESQKYFSDQARISALSARLSVAMDMNESDVRTQGSMSARLNTIPLPGQGGISNSEKKELEAQLKRGEEIINTRRAEIFKLYRQLVHLTENVYPPDTSPKSGETE